MSFSAAFFSYPTIVSFTAGVAGVFSALHNMWKAWCKQKKCGFMRFFDAESALLGGELSPKIFHASSTYPNVPE